ncbi:hypothetical protein RI129_000432 [Pyrocoelia pectoralis]|uniref:SCP domain-containing protein n=1 Tax=Pyrocoelia pectoralis TaxID=417401 RepID=A0AAN7ZVZ2_9COLE
MSILIILASLGVGSRNNVQIAAAVLSVHNQYRAKHGVPALVLDSQYLAQNSRFEHRPNNAYGENLYMGRFPGKTNLEIAQMGVKAWYDEITLYNFDVERVQSGALHFTQVVWRTSQKLGVGVGIGANGAVYLVCNYSPPGNFIGYFKPNVPKPIISQKQTRLNIWSFLDSFYCANVNILLLVYVTYKFN